MKTQSSDDLPFWYSKWLRSHVLSTTLSALLCDVERTTNPDTKAMEEVILGVGFEANPLCKSTNNYRKEGAGASCLGTFSV